MAATVNDELWPPQSARQALLSSPSGRKRYANFQAGKATSPIRRAPGTPSLLDRLRLARNNQDHIVPAEDEDEDDEETLQLKLAAIEAKLKLKKLQSKSKREETTLRPKSVAESSTFSQVEHVSRVEVALSPTKRFTAAVEQRSPSRVLLGIDKGIRGADISLRRAKTINSSPTKDRHIRRQDKAGRPSSSASAAYPAGKSKALPPIETKPFSERMAQVRDNDKKLAQKREDVARARTRTFKLDAVELEGFKRAAEESQSHRMTRSPARDVTHNVDDIQNTASVGQQKGLRKARTLPDLRQATEEPQGDASLFEGFSGLHLSSRILPHSFLKRTLPSDQFTMYRLPDLLKNITSPAYEIPDEVGDFVVFGVVASKSNPLDQKNKTEERTKSSNKWEDKWDDGTQNRKKFMVLTLTDLNWTVDLFLFGTALPRYHRLTPGTVIAVLNPSIMPPKQGREDTGAFSLALHDGDDTVLEIGSSKHLGFCNVVKKDGRECSQWVNTAKTEICEWHLNAQIAKTQAKRMGVNTGANGFGGGGARGDRGGQARGGGLNNANGLLPIKNGRGFDRESGSQFFISSSNVGSRSAPIYKSDVSTARMLDLDEDIFVAEGQFQRDKEAMLQKRLANQEKERDIARKLASFGSGSSAGANYMRRRADNDTSLKPDKGNTRPHPTGRPHAFDDRNADALRTTSQSLKTEIGRKRAAEDVRLSPMKKKTRFLTDKGIREAGRESMGANTGTSRFKHVVDNDDDDDDDDGLDIV